ncbi:hypothetical protein ACFQVD_22220 [Streptosporangium amethystogenes subsp. fukuiense]|uniref:Uncharacterized protein n=1 Tax=Streptosporangium amethystogenes subsp. fukuiense TaxID=698418 RepID=A0ABW2T398_9ACTN
MTSPPPAAAPAAEPPMSSPSLPPSPSPAGPEAEVGPRVWALHERGLARDVIDVASVSEPYGFRELEHLARLHDEGFSLAELVMRLEFVALIADEDFEAHGVAGERLREIRRFAGAWVEDIGLRRAEEGDIDHDDVPDPD